VIVTDLFRHFSHPLGPGREHFNTDQVTLEDRQLPFFMELVFRNQPKPFQTKVFPVRACGIPNSKEDVKQTNKQTNKPKTTN
jgi:hypothetical protein